MKDRLCRAHGVALVRCAAVPGGNPTPPARGKTHWWVAFGWENRSHVFGEIGTTGGGNPTPQARGWVFREQNWLHAFFSTHRDGGGVRLRRPRRVEMMEIVERRVLGLAVFLPPVGALGFAVEFGSWVSVRVCDAMRDRVPPHLWVGVRAETG